MKIFGFKSKSDEVLDHWISFVESFSLAPKEFYATVRQELETRKIPGLEISHIEYPEGGLLSDNRIYLRMLRERLAFDACAAPFGIGYFFSFRSVYSPAVVRLWHFIVLFLLLLLIGTCLQHFLGLSSSIIALVALIIAVGQVFRNVNSMGISNIDSLLLKTPALGPIYERWFRADTYYRQDARLVYMEAVSKVFKELAEEVVASKGLKLVKQFERAPIMGELYKPVPPSKHE
jgi:hypothetical protein